MNVNDLELKYKTLKSKNYKIDISRGKPSKEQLDLSNDMLTVLDKNFVFDSDDDPRNYGKLDGLDSCKRLFSQISGLSENNFIVYGNSSLNLQYELISDAFIKGIFGCTPWHKLRGVKWICLVPGYDRHFSICEYFGIKMIPVELKSDGPDMDTIEELIKDPLVKGIWCTPIYSNPLGITFSNNIVRRFASLKPAARDFRVFWDLAYCVHHLSKNRDNLLNVYDEARKVSNEDLFYIFFSTSKITYAGSGVAAVACSERNKTDILNKLKYKTICSDKVNQLRHVLFLKDSSQISKHMEKHSSIIAPKFKRFLDRLKSINSICKIVEPKGGYFISVFVKNGTAKKVIERCKKCGLVLTEAGCGYPYHNDPNDSHIRIAPTFLNMHEIDAAAEILSTAIELEYYLSEEK